MRDLCQAMEDVYDFINEAGNLENLAKSREGMLKRLWQQTHECAWFLRDQSKRKGFCEYFCLSP